MLAIVHLLALPVGAQAIITTVAGTEWIFPAASLPALSAPIGGGTALAAAPNGDVYIGDQETGLLFRLDPSGRLTIAAGNGIRTAGSDGPATGTPLVGPSSLAMLPNGEVALQDGSIFIRKLTVDGRLVRVAGAGGQSGSDADGVPALTARIYGIGGLAADRLGNLYYTELTGAHRVRKISPDGNVQTIAGGFETGFSGDGGPAIEARFNRPAALAVTAAGEVLVADTENRRIRMIDSRGIVRTVAGNGQSGSTGDGGPAIAAPVGVARGLLAEADGGFLFTSGNRIRRVSPEGIVTLVAGTTARYSGDGGPATSAGIGDPFGITRTPNGDLIMADGTYARIRRINSAGIISTIAGNGKLRETPADGPPRTALLFFPHTVAISPTGLVTFADRYNGGILRQIGADGVLRRLAGGVQETTDATVALSFRGNITGLTYERTGALVFSTGTQIFRLGADGRLTTLAGGAAGYGGDGGPAARALFNGVTGVLAGPGGELYVADALNYRIRKVGSDGVVTTFAGTGVPGFSGDGGPAAAAQISLLGGIPLAGAGMALDAAGNFYFSDTTNSRVRRISPDGIVRTVVGDGRAIFAGDGGPATAASISAPVGLCFDSNGNLLLAEGGRVRMVGRDGVIRTVAGGGPAGVIGDGGAPERAWLSQPTGVAVDGAGRIYVTEYTSSRIRAVLPTLPAFSVSTGEVSLADATPGEVRLDSPVAGLAYTATVTTGGDWLAVTPTTGRMPASLTLAARTTGLAPGRYTASVTIQAPLANPPTRVVSVTLTVDAPVSGGRLRLGAESISFSLQEAGVAGSAILGVEYTGTSVIPFSATPRTAAWLSVSPATGQLLPGTVTPVQVFATPAALAAGTYRATIDVTAGNETLTVPVTMALAAPQPKILLSQTGLTFIAVEGGGAPSAQRIGVLNEGAGILDFTAAATTFQGGPWIQLAGTAGRVTKPLEEVRYVDISVNAAGLAPGDYYAEVRVTSPGAAAQLSTIVLKVLPAGSDPGPEVTPSGIIFIGPSGARPGTENVSISNLVKASKVYTSSALTFDGARWLTQTPVTASVAPNEPSRMVVEPDFTGVTAGVKRGAVYLLFEDGTSRSVNVLSIVTGTARAAATCAGGALRGEFVSIPEGAPVTIGQPTALQVKFADECGNLLNAERDAGAGVVIRFGNGDPDLRMVPVGGGVWSGTWRPLTPSAGPVTLTAAAAYVRGLFLQAGVTTRTVRMNSLAAAVPILRQGSLVHAASQRGDAPVAPGTLVTLYGANLAGGRNVVTAAPLPTEVQGTQVILGGQALPMLFTSDTQINAQLPFDLAPNTVHQVVVRRNGILSVPETFAIADAQPGIFTINQRGTGQAAVLGPDQVTLADAANPARAGRLIVVYCTGLGAINRALTPGVAAPTSPLATTTGDVRLTVGGKTAQILFSGLAPGFAGLYQVNAILAADTPAGAAVPVVITVNGQASNAATISVQ